MAIGLLALLLLCGGGAARAQRGDGAGPGGSAQGRGPDGFAGGQMVRGTVTEATADALTVKTEAGESYKVTVTSNTRLMKARQPLKMTEVKAGDGVGAMGVMDAPTKTLHAAFVQIVDAEQIKKAQADLGKTYITGKLTAMDDVKLTVHRPDGVDQVIQVDEGTSFKRGGRGMGMLMGGMGAAMGEGAGPAAGGQTQRPQRTTGAQGGGGGGGESITLADVKIGDMVIGRGALKNGVFVPTELNVMDPAARQRRRAASEGAGATTAAPGAQP
jgi:hypothetical protein